MIFHKKHLYYRVGSYIYNQIFSGGKLLAGPFVGIEGMTAARSRRQGAHPAAGAKGEATSLGIGRRIFGFWDFGGCKKKYRNTPEVRRLPEFCEKMDEIHVNF